MYQTRNWRNKCDVLCVPYLFFESKATKLGIATLRGEQNDSAYSHGKFKIGLQIFLQVHIFLQDCGHIFFKKFYSTGSEMDLIIIQVHVLLKHLDEL